MTIHGKPINAGDILHLLQIMVLVLMMGMTYQQFQDMKASDAIRSDQLKRIDHYLASKDPLYYQITDGR